LTQDSRGPKGLIFPKPGRSTFEVKRADKVAVSFNFAVPYREKLWSRPRVSWGEGIEATPPPRRGPPLNPLGTQQVLQSSWKPLKFT